MGARGNEPPPPSCLPLAGGAACPACPGPRPPDRHRWAVSLRGTPVFVKGVLRAGTYTKQTSYRKHTHSHTAAGGAFMDISPRNTSLWKTEFTGCNENRSACVLAWAA